MFFIPFAGQLIAKLFVIVFDERCIRVFEIFIANTKGIACFGTGFYKDSSSCITYSAYTDGKNFMGRVNAELYICRIVHILKHAPRAAMRVDLIAAFYILPT